MRPRLPVRCALPGIPAGATRLAEAGPLCDVAELATATGRSAEDRDELSAREAELDVQAAAVSCSNAPPVSNWH